LSIESVYSCGRDVRQWYSGRTNSSFNDSDSSASRSSRKPRLGGVLKRVLLPASSMFSRAAPTRSALWLASS
jgi:hypothetical protein